MLPFKERPERSKQERPYLTKVQARALLGVGEGVLQTLLQQGVLHAIKKPIGSSAKRTMFLIEKASVDALQQAWSELVPLEILAQEYLGVTKAVVLALEDAGLLPPMRGPNSDGYKLRLYSRAAIGQFERAVLSHAVKLGGVPTEAMLPLTAFSSKAGVSLVTLLTEIFNGFILPFEIKESWPLFRRVVLPKEKIAHFLDEYKHRQREKQGLLTPAEVAVNLDIGEKVLRRWVQWGLIEGEKLSIDGKKPSLLFRKPALENFRHNYIFTKEAAELLGVVPQMVSKYVQERLLHPIAEGKARVGGNYFIFRRDEVTALVSSKNSSVIRKEELF